ncbi:unnamed protein product [Acanthoscelides obtectus]|uniref:Uncharacterized protein n=1 Tax=Acanthoscelides obtectus TaxID=200917 RepID=A0A9P0Q2S4_ACAOB|nr:unnamed protein product [Acanthoscelides obtectus]CAK1646066.1 hypothetical protein AOBTE_LOCUS14431 [Acanthoscelides obtectus]
MCGPGDRSPALLAVADTDVATVATVDVPIKSVHPILGNTNHPRTVLPRSRAKKFFKPLGACEIMNEHSPVQLCNANASVMVENGKLYNFSACFIRFAQLYRGIVEFPQCGGDHALVVELCRTSEENENSGPLLPTSCVLERVADALKISPRSVKQQFKLITTKVKGHEQCTAQQLMSCAKPLSLLTDSGLTFVSSKADLDKICPFQSSDLDNFPTISTTCFFGKKKAPTVIPIDPHIPDVSDDDFGDGENISQTNELNDEEELPSGLDMLVPESNYEFEESDDETEPPPPQRRKTE